MIEAPVIINSLNRSYGQVNALKDINIKIRGGELFGLIGPDGAGKTTLFRILTTLLLPDSGTARIGEFDVVRDFRKIRNITGYMAGRFSLYQDLTVEENLNFYATVFGTTMKENYELIRDIYSHIEPFKKRRAGKLSGGMKQKLALSCALIHKPSILILDEPTTGVDAVSRKEFWEMLLRLKAYGITILVSTPYMDEASLCDRVALIQDGCIMSVDTPRKITSGHPGNMYVVRATDIYKLKDDLQAFQKTGSVHLFGQDLHLTLQPNTDIEDLQDFLMNSEHENVTIDATVPTIEDCFLELMIKK